MTTSTFSLPINAYWPPDFLIHGKPIKIAIVGEAPGATEEKEGRPFVGWAGRELKAMLREVGIDMDECLVTNVFNVRPPGNHIEAFCAPKKEVGGKDYPYHQLKQGFYVRPEHFHHLQRLKDELERAKPNLILALGNVAIWAVINQTGIMARRGYVFEGTLAQRKVLAAIHPAAVLRDWSLRVLCSADFLKARQQMEYQEIRRPVRHVWVEPSIEDLHKFGETYLWGKRLPWISSDIETHPSRRMIRCVSIATGPDLGITIPFTSRDSDDWCYWKTLEEEIAAWQWLRRIYAEFPVLGQNFSYDFQYLYRLAPVLHYNEDTMLKSHSLFPELAKGLGFMGSIYTNESAWKLMRPRGKQEAKREE